MKPITVLLSLLVLVGSAPAIDSLNFRTIGFYQTTGMTFDIAVDSDYAFITDINRSLRVISIADPEHLFEAAHFDTANNRWGVTIVKKSYIYLPDSASGVHVLSIDSLVDSAQTVEVGFLSTPNSVGSIAVAGQYAYMTNGGELLVVSVADPASPAIVATFDPSDTMICNVAASGDYAYVLDYDHGLIVVSVADPLHPIEVGRCDLAYTYRLVVSGSYVWAGGRDGSSVVSVADPAHPTKVGSHSVAQVTDVAMDGDVAYLAASGWINAVSIADPVHPLDIGYYYSRSHANGVALVNGYVYSAGAEGLLIVQHYESGVEETPNAGLRALKVEPTFGRSMPAGAVLFDAMGRRVANPRSGVYFMREKPEASSYKPQAVRKIILQR